jgi:hypothetical protein
VDELRYTFSRPLGFNERPLHAVSDKAGDPQISRQAPDERSKTHALHSSPYLQTPTNDLVYQSAVIPSICLVTTGREWDGHDLGTKN